MRHRQELEREIADLKARRPKHSPLLRHYCATIAAQAAQAVQAVPPAMLVRLVLSKDEGLEELEEELERLLRPFDWAQGKLCSGQALLRTSERVRWLALTL